MRYNVEAGQDDDLPVADLATSKPSTDGGIPDTSHGNRYYKVLPRELSSDGVGETIKASRSSGYYGQPQPGMATHFRGNAFAQTPEEMFKLSTKKGPSQDGTIVMNQPTLPSVLPPRR